MPGMPGVIVEAALGVDSKVRPWRGLRATASPAASADGTGMAPAGNFTVRAYGVVTQPVADEGVLEDPGAYVGKFDPGVSLSWVLVTANGSSSDDLTPYLAWDGPSGSELAVPGGFASYRSAGIRHGAPFDLEASFVVAAGDVTVTFAVRPKTGQGGWVPLGGPSEHPGGGPVQDSLADLVIGQGSPEFERMPARVEISFAGTPVASPDFAVQPAGTTSFDDDQDLTWTVHGTIVDPWTRIDVDNPPRSIQTERGVSMKLAEFETGIAGMVLDNRNGWLTPGNSASPYYPDLGPDTRIRVRLDFGGVLTLDGDPVVIDGDPIITGHQVDLFTGFLERLPIDWELGDGTVNVEAFDLLGLVADETLPASVYEAATSATGPVAHWPLAEESFVIADDIAGTHDGRYRLDPAPADLLPHAAGGQIFSVFTQQGKKIPQVIVRPFPATSAFTIAVWVKAETNYPMEDGGGGLNYSAFLWTQDGFPTPNWSGVMLFVETSGVPGGRGRVRLFMDDSGGTNSQAIGTELYAVDVLDGDPHLVVATCDGVSTQKIFVDGVDIPTFVSSSSGSFPTVPPTPSTPVVLGNDNDVEAVGVTIESEFDCRWVAGQYGYWDRVLTTGEIAGLYDAGVNAWDGDRTGDRLHRVLDLLGVDGDDRDIDTGSQVCSSTGLGGQNAMEYLRLIAATELGGLFVAPDGRLMFRERPANAPVPAVTYAGNAAEGVPYMDVTPDHSTDRVITAAEVTREGGNVQRHEQPAQRRRVVQVDTLHRTPSGARGTAARLVNRNIHARTILTDLALASRTEDVPPSASLGREIGDAVTVIARPPGSDAISQLSLVERVEHDLDWHGDRNWVTRLGLDEAVVFPCLAWDTAGQGWDQSVWCEQEP